MMQFGWNKTEGRHVYLGEKSKEDSEIPKDSGGNALIGVPVTFTVDAEALISASLSTVAHTPAEIDDDGADSATITAVLKDTDDDAVVGFAAASNVLSATGTGNTITQPAAVSTIGGVMTGSLVSTVAATKVVTATAAGLAVTDTTSVVVTAGVPSGDAFEMDYTAGAAEAAGWSIGPNDAYSGGEFDTARQAGIGPSGEDGYRFTWTAPGAGFGGEYNMGWGSDFGEVTPFVAGDTAYFRWKWRLGSGANGRFRNSSGTLQECRTKILVCNDSYGSEAGRPILSFNVQPIGVDGATTVNVRFNWYKGGTSLCFAPYVEVDTAWHTVQAAVKYSSTTNATDGAVYIWVDGAAEGSPDASATGIIMNIGGGGVDSAPGYVKFPVYQNNGLASDGVQVLDHCLFAISDAFTSGWTP